MAEMPQAQAPAAQGGAGNASELVADIHSKMTELMDLLSSSQAAAPEDKQALGQIIQAYQSFVQENLGAAPGKAPMKEQPPGPKGPVAMEAGASDAKPMM